MPSSEFGKLPVADDARAGLEMIFAPLPNLQQSETQDSS